MTEVQLAKKLVGMCDAGVTAPGPQVAQTPTDTLSVSRDITVLFAYKKLVEHVEQVNK